MAVRMKDPRERAGEEEELQEEAMAAAGPLAEVREAGNSDSDSDQELEGIYGHRERTKNPVCLRSCQTHSIMPASCFFRQRIAGELNLRHRGLGPQGAQAVASTLTANPSIKRLDLRDNGLCRTGAEVLAAVLRKSSSICENQTVQKIQLAGNCLEEQAAQHLATFLLAHTRVKSLDLSYNQLNDLAGEILGPALAENSGLTELNISWNHLRGSGATAFAKGLEANIFLKVLDISYNGFGDSGASAVGEALKANNVLEELNLSNNRISAVGALRLGLGLRVNQTLRILVVSRNPMKSEGCFGLLKSVRDNQASALELLDFSDIQVNKEFDDFASSVKAILPGLCLKTGIPRPEYKKELLTVFKPLSPTSTTK
ncbi:leucine-rich repeat-containing protein 74B isoform 2-T2 [Thomomys bottae]